MLSEVKPFKEGSLGLGEALTDLRAQDELGGEKPDLEDPVL